MKNAMKKVAFLLVVGSVLLSFTKAEGAKISFKKEVHDFGSIAFESDGKCTFEFINTGDSELVIADVKRACGCTTPTWTKEPIAPGAKGSITAQYDTKRVGDFDKTITVVSNAANEPNKTLRIKGKVLPAAVTGSPENIVGPMN